MTHTLTTTRLTRLRLPGIASLATLVAVCLLAPEAPAREAKVRIAALTLHSVELDEGTVRTTLGEEIEALDQARPTKRSAVLTVSVAKRAHDDGALEYVVSAVVGDAAGGKMLGMVEGHAHASGGHATSALDRRVLRLAAHGAMEQLPAVLK